MKKKKILLPSELINDNGRAKLLYSEESQTKDHTKLKKELEQIKLDYKKKMREAYKKINYGY